MKKIPLSLLASLVLGILSPFPASAQSEPPAKNVKVTFPDFPESKHIHGPKITIADLEGKVVFYEYWGINCPPCIASMPHLQSLQKKYGDKGFIVVGAHSQGLSEKVKIFLKEQKITFPIYQQVRIPEAPCPGGIPYAVLIGANGRVVAKGHPSDLYNLVKKEMGKVGRGYPILEGVKLNKYKSLESVLISKGTNLESKISSLRSKEGDQEAEEICQVFDAWVESSKKSVAKIIEDSPLQAIPAIISLKNAVPSIKEFDEDLAKLKANRDLPKLAALQKKVADLELLEMTGGKIDERLIKSLAKDLDKFAESDNDTTSSVATKLKTSLEALNNPSENVKDGGKKVKNEKKTATQYRAAV